MLDRGRYRPESCRAGCLKCIETVIPLPALALTIQRSATTMFIAVILRDGKIAGSTSAVGVFRIPFFRLTKPFRCFPIPASPRFPDSSCKAVVTGFGAVGAPLKRRTSARTLHPTDIALCALVGKRCDSQRLWKHALCLACL